MKVELFTMVYNEQELLPGLVQHYRNIDPDIAINIYDNGSTDNTIEIATELGCVVEKIDSSDKLQEEVLTNFKNNVWKQSKADWIVICDADEWVDMDPFFLNNSVAFYICEGYDMIGGVDSEYGIRNPLYDKVCFWNRQLVDETNYAHGAHQCFPVKRGVKGNYRPKLYHMRYLSKEYVISRYNLLAKRMSEHNKKHGFGKQYLATEQEISEFMDYLDSIKLKVK